MKARILLLGIVAAFLSGSPPVSGVGRGGDSAGDSRGVSGQMAADTLFIRMERERFEYPAGPRRDPFAGGRAPADDAPRFEDLSLLGVLLSAEGERGIALIRSERTGDRDLPLIPAGGGESPPGVSSPLRRMRIGDRWGGIRILAIEDRRVVLEVMEGGERVRKVLTLSRREGENEG